MAPIYSTKLVNVLNTAAFSGVVYTVPAGATVVVTDIDYWMFNNPAGAGSYVELGANITAWHQPAAMENTSIQWRGKQVLDAGDTIQFVTSAPVNSLAITGYLLRP